ncbi:MAG TPA: chemotaxis protein CheA, partial [Sphingomicrobium sp.]|nr:chemotaxis protein CheA [Sphingomicrobium sp.]
LVDAHWLFAHHLGSAASATTDQPLCRLPSGDPWMQNMLRPIVEAVGYRVVGDDHDGEADLVITSEPKKAGKAARTIVLRSEPEAAGKTDQSIYRYDRAGLLMALKSAGGKR